MKFLDADVKKPLAAVSEMVDAGNTVVFSKSGSYVEEGKTGERIELARKGNTFVMRLDGRGSGGKRAASSDAHGSGPMEVDQVEQLAERLMEIMERDRGEGETVFRRRAQ